jgi:hypothetical protein
MSEGSRPHSRTIKSNAFLASLADDVGLGVTPGVTAKPAGARSANPARNTAPIDRTHGRRWVAGSRSFARLQLLFELSNVGGQVRIEPHSEGGVSAIKDPDRGVWLRTPTVPVGGDWLIASVTLAANLSCHVVGRRLSIACIRHPDERRSQ